MDEKVKMQLQLQGHLSSLHFALICMKQLEYNSQSIRFNIMKFNSQSKFPFQKQNNPPYSEDHCISHFPTFKHPERMMVPVHSTNLCTSRSTQKEFLANSTRGQIEETDYEHDRKMREGYEELAQITKREFQNLTDRNIFLKKELKKQDKRIQTLEMQLQRLQNEMQQMINEMNESNQLNEIEIKIKTAPPNQSQNSALDTTFFDKSHDQHQNALQNYLKNQSNEEESNSENIFQQRITELSHELQQLMEECARQKNINKKKGYREELKGLANTLKRVKSSDHFTSHY